LCIESVIRSLLSNSGLELSGTASLEAADTWMLPRRDVPLPPNTDRRIVLRKLSMFLIESRSRRRLTSKVHCGLQASRLQKRDRAALVLASNLHFFLDTAVRKDYIHGALIFYSDIQSFSVGTIVWTRFRPGRICGYRPNQLLVTGLCGASATRRNVDGLTIQRLFTLSAFNSRLGG